MVLWSIGLHTGTFGSIGMKSSSMTRRPILTKFYSTKSLSSSGSAKLLRRKRKSWTSKDTRSPIKLQLISPSPKRMLLEIGLIRSLEGSLLMLEKQWINLSLGQVHWLEAPSSFSVISCRSFIAGSLKQARILILREVFLRAKEFDISHIHCRDQKKTWENLFRNSTPIKWEIFPAYADFVSLFVYAGFFFQEWHPLCKEVQKLATKAARNFVSMLFP